MKNSEDYKKTRVELVLQLKGWIDDLHRDLEPAAAHSSAAIQQYIKDQIRAYNNVLLFLTGQAHKPL